MSIQRHRLIMVLLLCAVVVFQFHTKKRPDDSDINNYRSFFGQNRSFIGQTAPDFEVRLADGRLFRLSDQLGTNVVFLNFFTTWCGPCQTEMPELQHFYDTHRDQSVVFLAIDVGEDPALVAKYIEKHELTFPVGLDEMSGVAEKYRIGSYPTTVGIEPNGTIIMYEVGVIANADVSLTPVASMYVQFGVTGEGFDVEEYKGRAPEQLFSQEDEEHVHDHFEIELSDEDEGEVLTEDKEVDDSGSE